MIDVVGRGPEISRVVRWFGSDGPTTLVIDGSAGAGIGDAVYTVVADMVVPAGKYHVTARGTVNNQTGAPVDYVACNAYGGSSPIDSGTTSAPLQYAGFAIDGTIDLASGGTIRVECISSVAGAPLPFVGLSLVAVSAAGITVLP